MKNKSKLFLLLTLAVSLSGLSGCGGGSDTETPPAPTGPEAFVEGTAPRFNPIISDLPFNTDFLFADAAATDGTANVGDPAGNAVRAAINVMDGLSTSAYFDILINGSVASPIAPGRVFLMRIVPPTPPATQPSLEMAQYDVQVVSLDGGHNNVIRVRPTKPLKAKSRYLVFLTNDILDTDGKPLTRSWHYNALGDSTFQVSGRLLAIQTAIIGWENAASAALVVGSGGQLSPENARKKIVLSYTFTTTDPIAPLVAMASPRAAIVSAKVSRGATPQEAIADVVGYESGGYLPTPKARPLGISSLTGVDINTLLGGALTSNVGTLYTGYIKLPYYQTARSGDSFTYLAMNWRPDAALAAEAGFPIRADLDGSYNVTYHYPFAAKTTDETIPLQVTMPRDTWIPEGDTETCAEQYSETGYPVVIYVHGITSDRTSIVMLSHKLSSRCIATVAIDLPLHGVAATNTNYRDLLNVQRNPNFAALYGDNTPHERHFNVAGPGGLPREMNFIDTTAADGSGAQFTNLGYLANTRDNNRQAVMDLLNLNASLVNVSNSMVAMDNVDVGLDLDRVYLIGMSLGGIIGEVFATVNQLAIANDAQIGQASNLNPLSGVILASAGSQVSQIMTQSPTFGPIINAGLTAQGAAPGTTNYERFVYAAQATLDSADVVNFAETFATLGVPVLLTQIANDSVIVNSTPVAPLAGTTALANLMGMTQFGEGEHVLGRGFVKMERGGHSSMLRPEGTPNPIPAITYELQEQAASFIENDGVVNVGDYAADDVEEPVVP